MNSSSHKIDPSKFPKEKGKGTVKIVDDNLIFEGKDALFGDGTVPLSRVKYIYLVVRDDGQAYLYLDKNSSYIPVHYRGFAEIYQTLSERFHFNDEQFFTHVHKQTRRKKQLWRAIQSPTYEILNTTHIDYEKGFEVQSPEKKFISWDIPYANLKEQYGNILQIEDKDQYEIITFRYPIRLENIVFDNLTASVERRKRTDAPVIKFQCYCYDREGSDRSYYDLKERLLKDGKADHKFELDNFRELEVKWGDISAKLNYNYDGEYGGFELGYTILSISNQREYPTLKIDKAYEKKMEISDFIVLYGKDIHLAGNYNFSLDYRINHRVKRRPPKISAKAKEKPVIWRDNRNHKIGFAGKTEALILDQAEIETFALQNLVPAKGGGRADLYLNLADEEKRYPVFSGSYQALDRYVKKIEGLTQKEVQVLPEVEDI